MKAKRTLMGALAIVAFTIAASQLLAGNMLSAPSAPAADPAAIPALEQQDAAQAGELVKLAQELLVIDGAAPKPDYRRDEFGARWADTDGNGCDQRQDVLTRDLIDITRDGCTVLTGTLQDPYTGAPLNFQHDRVAVDGNPGSQGVQIDHIISLSAAYEGGAWHWSSQERERFANETTNLLAVDGKTNQSKSDRGPASWMPPDPSYWCAYATKYTQVATDWKLAVTVDDRAMLIETLAACAPDEARGTFTIEK